MDWNPAHKLQTAIDKNGFPYGLPSALNEMEKKYMGAIKMGLISSFQVIGVIPIGPRGFKQNSIS